MPSHVSPPIHLDGVFGGGIVVDGHFEQFLARLRVGDEPEPHAGGLDIAVGGRESLIDMVELQHVDDIAGRPTCGQFLEELAARPVGLGGTGGGEIVFQVPFEMRCKGIVGTGTLQDEVVGGRARLEQNLGVYPTVVAQPLIVGHGLEGPCAAERRSAHYLDGDGRGVAGYQTVAVGKSEHDVVFARLQLQELQRDGAHIFRGDRFLSSLQT